MSEPTLPNTSPDPGTTTPATEPAATPPEEKTIPYERFKQVNDQLKELREWKATQDAAASKQAEEAKAAEEKRLAEQQEYQKLAERFKAEAEGLKPHQAKAERYAAALTTLLETERKGLPKHITELLDKMDPADQLEYIAKNKSALSPAAVPDINGASSGQGKKPGPGEQMQTIASKYGVSLPTRSK